MITNHSENTKKNEKELNRTEQNRIEKQKNRRKRKKGKRDGAGERVSEREKIEVKCCFGEKHSVHNQHNR